MIQVGFFIRKLRRELEEMHKAQQSQFQKAFVVYRGQGFTPERLQQLTNTQGGLLSFNNFLSTSMDREISMVFVATALAKKENFAVLFMMTIDPNHVSCSKIPFAVIDTESYFPPEKEVLFSMHTIFSVCAIKQSSTNARLWEVELTLTDDDDPQLSDVMRAIRQEIQRPTGWNRMSQLMYR